MNAFDECIRGYGEAAQHATDLGTIVVNVTHRCNQACAHCHLGCSPERPEVMSPEVIARVLEIVDEVRPDLVDVTGGAPELCPDVPAFVGALRSAGHRVQLRTNLTVLAEPEHAELPRSWAAQKVAVLASLPCYTDRNVRAVRGSRVRDASVEVLQELNALGYGIDPELTLDLAYNPVGATLPEDQGALEALFREELATRFGVSFTRLRTIANTPVGRFRDKLVAEGSYRRYLRALRESFNPATLPFLMCRHQIEVGWDGRLYDCDFNLAAGLPTNSGSPTTVWDFDAERVAGRRITHAEHCLACTAGAGSS